MISLSLNQYEYNCAKTSGKIILSAIHNNVLPNRTTHFQMIFSQLVKIPFTAVCRISEFCENVIEIPLIPFSSMTNRKMSLVYKISRLILDPLNVLSSIAAGIVRLVGNILGIITPKAAAYCWIAAEILEKTNLALRINFEEKLMGQSNDISMLLFLKNNVKRKIFRIHNVISSRKNILPKNAIAYLGIMPSANQFDLLSGRTPESKRQLRDDYQEQNITLFRNVLSSAPELQQPWITKLNELNIGGLLCIPFSEQMWMRLHSNTVDANINALQLTDSLREILTERIAALRPQIEGLHLSSPLCQSLLLYTQFLSEINRSYEVVMESREYPKVLVRT